MRIAISQRVDSLTDRDETRNALDQRLSALFAQAGLIPLLVPNSLDVSARDAWLATIDPAGVVLSGGNDIGQVPARDATETALLDFARAQKLPSLGICRVMQMMAHIAGGRLARVAGHVRTRHDLIGTDARNDDSFNDWAPADCPSGYSVTTRNEDGTIEAIGHATLPRRGWMWHSERETTIDPRGLGDIQYLFGTRGTT